MKKKLFKGFFLFFVYWVHLIISAATSEYLGESPLDKNVLLKTVGKIKRSQSCTSRLDVIFVLDMSGSVHRTRWMGKVVPFVYDFADEMNVKKDGTHIGIVNYSGKGGFQSGRYVLLPYNKIQISLGSPESSDITKFHKTRSKLMKSYVGGGTMTGGALKFTRTKMLNVANGKRPNVPSLVLVITDGISSDRHTIVPERKEYEKQKITLAVIGVGNVDESKNRELAGCVPYSFQPCPLYFKTEWHLMVQEAKKFQAKVCETLPVDAKCGDFGEWSTCSAKCGPGVHKRSRSPYTILPPKAGSSGQMGLTCQQQGLRVTEFKPCNPTPCPIDAQASPWKNWGPCKGKCGSGVMNRYRVLIRKEKYGGKTLRQQRVGLVQARSCQLKPCPIDAVPGDFGPFGPCSASQGWGTKTATRAPNKAEAKYGGRTLQEQKIQTTKTEKCKIREIPVNAGCGDYSAWTDCSASCGPGKQTRTRTTYNSPQAIHGGLSCEAQNKHKMEERQCNLSPCPKPVMSDWSPCTSTCGRGQKSRTVTLQGKVMSTSYAVCNLGPCPINASCGNWEEWGECSATCGAGTKKRARANFNNPPAKYGGSSCEAQGFTEEEEGDCKTAECPIDAVAGDWNEWSECSSTCGDGTKTRDRQDPKIDAQHGGKTLKDQGISESETQKCNSGPCPINEKCGQMGEWGKCSASCGGGARYRSRGPSVSAPMHGGQTCQQQGLPITESENCNSQDCPKVCYTEWTGYSPCSATCGVGNRFKNRVLILPGESECTEEVEHFEVCKLPPCPTTTTTTTTTTEATTTTETTTEPPTTQISQLGPLPIIPTPAPAETSTAPSGETTTTVAEETTTAAAEEETTTAASEETTTAAAEEETTTAAAEETTTAAEEETTTAAEEETTTAAEEETTTAAAEETTTSAEEETTTAAAEETTTAAAEEETTTAAAEEETTTAAAEEETTTAAAEEETTTAAAEEETTTAATEEGTTTAAAEADQSSPPTEETTTETSSSTEAETTQPTIVAQPPESPETKTDSTEGPSGGEPQVEEVNTEPAESTEAGGGSTVAVAGGIVGGVMLAAGAGAGAFYFKQPSAPGGGPESLPEFDEIEKLDQDIDIEDDEYAINIAGESDFWAST